MYKPLSSFFQSMIRQNQESSQRPDMYRKRVLAELNPVTPVDDTLSRLRLLQKASKSRQNKPETHWHGSDFSGKRCPLRLKSL